jgi:hypothetical protein
VLVASVFTFACAIRGKDDEKEFVNHHEDTGRKAEELKRTELHGWDIETVDSCKYRDGS